jgi:hypothetical protein
LGTSHVVDDALVVACHHDHRLEQPMAEYT